MSRYQTAIDIQDACNPSGVAKTFFDLCAEVRAEGGDVKRDPALRLIAYKLSELMGDCTSLSTAYAKAFEACQTKLKESNQ